MTTKKFHIGSAVIGALSLLIVQVITVAVLVIIMPDAAKPVSPTTTAQALPLVTPVPAAPESTATPTPAYTPTPKPTAKPLFAPKPKLTPAVVLDNFIDAGLEVEDRWDLGEDNYGVYPVGISGIEFYMPSICEKCAGRVMQYKDEEMAQFAYGMYEKVSMKQQGKFLWYYTRGDMVMIISYEAPISVASEYNKVFRTAK